MTVVFDPYRVLNVPRDAEFHAIRAAYRTLAWQWHPDRGGSPAQMIQINEAWRILGHQARRAAHDAAIQRGASTSVAAPAYASDAPEVVTRPPQSVIEPGVITYGRYAGWSISQLVNHDPDFLEWLLRMPAGRQHATQIRAALERRERLLADLAPKAAPRRSLLGFRAAGAR